MQSPPPLPPLPPVNLYAAPAARLEDEQVGTWVLADHGQRLGAAIIDFIAFYGVVFACGMFAAILGGSFAGVRNGESSAFVFIMIGVMGLGILAIGLVNLRLVALYGQTIGKRLLDIRMVRSDGSRLSPVRFVFARWLPLAILKSIPWLGFAIFLIDSLLIFGGDRRCLHDLIADTIVVKN
jgi:uncharacterized RDD family membrane protein YckC